MTAPDVDPAAPPAPTRARGRTPKRPTVIEALAAIRRDLPGIEQGDQSDEGYRYRGVESITSHVGPLLGRHGVVITPHVRSWDEVELTVNNRPATDQRLEVEYTVFGPAGDHITVGPICAIGRDDSDKGGNKALTQAYKYMLLQVFAIGDKASDADRDVARRRDSRNPWNDAGWYDGKAEHDTAWEACKSKVTDLGLDRDRVRDRWDAGGFRLPLSRDRMDEWADTLEQLRAELVAEDQMRADLELVAMNVAAAVVADVVDIPDEMAELEPEGDDR